MIQDKKMNEISARVLIEKLVGYFNRDQYLCFPSLASLSEAGNFNISSFGVDDLDEISFNDAEASAYPWTLSDFESSIQSHHLCLGVKYSKHGTETISNTFGSESMAGQWVAHMVFSGVLDELELLVVGVKANWKKCGLAKTMLSHVLDTARSIGFSKVVLEVRSSNVAAKSLYEKLGFRQDGVRTDYYMCREIGPSERTREDALLYSLDLRIN